MYKGSDNINNIISNYKTLINVTCHIFRILNPLLGYLVSIFVSWYAVRKTYDLNNQNHRPFINVQYTSHIEINDILYYSESKERLFYADEFIILSNPSEKLATDLLMKIIDTKKKCIDIVEIDYIKNNQVLVLPNKSAKYKSIEISFKYDNKEFGHYIKTFGDDDKINYKFKWKKKAKKLYNSIHAEYQKQPEKSLHRLIVNENQVNLAKPSGPMP